MSGVVAIFTAAAHDVASVAILNAYIVV